MTIYFLRHASAGQRVINPKKDEQRGLDEDGIQQCRHVGRALAAMEIQVDAIISSPLKRASQTAALVANEMGHEGKLQLDPALRPEASFSQFRELLARYAKADAVMVVGHNPNLSEFLGRSITRGAGRAEVNLKKGAVAQVETKRNSAVLRWCLTPKAVGAIQAMAAESSRPKTSRK
jgi:phosphohistidine phosphatase